MRVILQIPELTEIFKERVTSSTDYFAFVCPSVHPTEISFSSLSAFRSSEHLFLVWIVREEAPSAGLDIRASCQDDDRPCFESITKID